MTTEQRLECWSSKLSDTGLPGTIRTGRGKEGVCPESAKEHDLLTLMLGFCSPEVWGMNFCCFKPFCCYSSSRKQTNCLNHLRLVQLSICISHPSSVSAFIHSFSFIYSFMHMSVIKNKNLNHVLKWTSISRNKKCILRRGVKYKWWLKHISVSVLALGI